MKKITLLFFMLCSIAGYSQLALEGFEGAAFPPTDWSRHNIAGPAQQWIQGDVATGQPAHEGTKTAYINREQMPDGTFSEDYLVSKPFTVPANPQVRFWSRLTIAGNQGNTYKVMVLPAGGDPNDPTDYVLLEDWTEPEINPSNEEWRHVFVSNSTFAGYTGQTVRIAFVMLGDFGDRWLLDEVEVVTECLTPENLTANNITQTSAVLSWGNPSGATAWEIEILENTAAPTGTGITINTMPYTVSGLNFDTCYKYYVKAECTATNESEWEGPYTFCTVAPGATCNAPWVINTLPFSISDNTGNFGDDFEGSPGGSGCGTTFNYLDGDEVVYAYTAPANGVISIDATGLGNWAGMFVYDNCNDIGVECIAGGTGSPTSPISVPLLTVTAGTTYYIVISTWPAPQSTPYNLVVQQVNCAPPSGLPTTNIGQTSADLSWTNPSGATSWEIVIQAPGGGIPPGAGTTVTTNTNYPATGLTGATPYEYWVRAACGDGTFSAWAGPYLFNTTICEATDQCTYTFIMTDSWGDGWNGNTMTVSQNGITIATIGSTFTWAQGFGPVTVTVPVCDDLPLELFWNTGGGFDEEVGVSIQNNFGQVFYTKPPGTGVENTVLYSGTIDCDTPLCLPPGGLTATNITTTTAEINWAGPNTGNWDYYVVPAGDPAPTAATPGINTIAKPVQLTNLTAATNYQYYVRLVCDATTSSAWAGPFNFNTAVCESSAQCNFIFSMYDDWGDGWDNTMTIYQGGVPVATIGATFTNGAGPIDVEVPLCPGVPFEIFWNSGGSFPGEVGLTVYSPFMEDIFSKEPGTGTPGTVIFSNDGTLASCTPPPCPKPQDLVVTNLLTTSAELGWTEMGTATSWEVEVVPFGDAPTGVGTATTDNPVLWDDLTSGTTYQFYVRALCGGTDGNSNWSGPITFTTAIENDNCIGALPVPVNAGGECIEFATGTLTGATGSTEAQTCITWAPIDWDVWYSFTATATTHAVAVTDQIGAFYQTVIYSGDDCSSLTQLACGDDNQVVSGLTIGDTYYVRVYTTWLPDPTDPTSFHICVQTPEPPIAVSETAYTVEELVTEVLIDADCALVSNITYQSGSSMGGPNSIGYFTQNGSDFPFEDGVVLTTGVLSNVPGPWTGTNIAGDPYSWTGDTELQAFNAAAGWPATTHNATILEFDFIPTIPQLDFQFLYASDEYGTFQCGFSDMFAFILTNETAATPAVNLAVIPSTTIPVSATYINDSQWNGGCPSQNPEYFGVYNEANPNAAAINFKGQTVVMQAQSAVIPGNTYHIKLVIADYSDASYNSAVFIGGGSFNFGQIDLGDAMLEFTGTAACDGETVVLDSEMDPAVYDFVWTQDGIVMPGETGPSINVTEEGEYGVEATFTGTDCAANGSVVIQFYDPIVEITNDPLDLNVCDASGFASFNLEENTPVILGDLPGTINVTYHLSQADAEQDTGALTSPYTNVVQYQQPIFVRIETAMGCLGYKTFNLNVEDLTPDFDIPATVALCEGGTGTITVVPGNFDPMGANVSFTWTHDGTPMPDTGSSISVTAAGVYEVVVNNTGCTATASTTVTVSPTPDAAISYAGTPYCANAGMATVTQTGNLGGTYSSSAGLVIDPVTGEIDLAASEPGTYTVNYDIAQTATCDAFNANTQIVITPLPVAGFSYDAPTFCVNFPSTVAPSYATGATAGTFTVDAAGLDIDPSTGIFNPATSTAGTYIVTNTIAAANGCEMVPFSQTITIIDAPVPVFSYSQAAYCQEDATDPSPIFTATSVAGTFSATPAGLVIDSSTGIIDLSASQPGTYTVTNTIAETAECAEVSHPVTVVINATPVFTLGGPYNVCDAQFATITVDAENFTAGTASYVWTLDGVALADTGSSITASGFGTYEVTVTTADGCVDSGTVTVTENTENIVFSFFDGCEDNIYSLEVEPVDGSFDPDTASFTWTGPEGFVAPAPGTMGMATIMPDRQGVYTVTFVTPEGCTGTNSYDVPSTSCFIQKGISPGDDTKNNTFDLTALDVTSLSIFNRYGQEVFSYGAYTNQWGGQDKHGNELPTGTYFYSFERSNGETKTGWIYVNRQN